MGWRWRALLVLALALALLVPWFGDSHVVKLATRILIFALAATALDVVLGLGGLVSFGHAAFLGLGAYVVGIMFLHDFEGTTFLGMAPTQNIFLQFLLAAVLTGGFAVLTGAVCLRTRGVAFIMITLAFAQMLFYFFVSLRRYNGEDGIALWSRSLGGGWLDLEDLRIFYYFTLACLLLFLTFAIRLYHSRFGRVIRGSKDNDRRMQALGFSTYRYRLTAYALSAAGTAVAGVLLANATYFVGPAYLSWQMSGQLIVMVVLGGIGTIVGPVLGAALFLLLEEFLPDALDLVMAGAGEYWRLALGPLLILVALFARRGLLGALVGGHRPPRPAAVAMRSEP